MFLYGSMRQAFQQLSLLPGRLCTRPMSSSSSVPRATIVKSPQTFLTSNTATYGLKKRKRLGRGSAGKGKTAGRGMKGFKARQSRSTPTPGFEGGQSGIIKALPKIGLQSKVRDRLFHSRLRLDTLQYLLDSGKLDASKPITLKELMHCGCIGKVTEGVVLLTRGAQFFTGKVDLQVSAASSAAIEAIEQNGGSIQTVFHSKETLAWMAAPHKYAIPPKGLELPPTKALLEYYMREDKRGYLVPLVQGVEPKDAIRQLIEKTRLSTGAMTSTSSA